MSNTVSAFAKYLPPKEIKEVKFSINLDAEDHARLLWWLDRNRTPEIDTRAAAARVNIRAALDAAGVPSADQILKSHNIPARKSAIELFLDANGIPSAEEIRNEVRSTRDTL